MARNKRRRSAARYKGLTNKKGKVSYGIIQTPTGVLHYIYRGLQYIEMTDGTSIINVYCDDASGFRLSTLNKQYSSKTVIGSDILTTCTDYVNRYKSVLQTTSYNFTGAKNTQEYCAGVVKAVPLFDKSPAQHAADFVMLQNKEELQNVFVKPDGTPNGRSKAMRALHIRSNISGQKIMC